MHEYQLWEVIAIPKSHQHKQMKRKSIIMIRDNQLGIQGEIQDKEDKGAEIKNKK